MSSLQLTINNQRFIADFADNATVKQFQSLLPLELTLSDHLNNEKYAQLPKPLPSEDTAVGSIEAGDIMLYQGDTVVVFYENFTTRYQYTRLAKIRDTAQLKQALGSDKVKISFIESVH